MFLCWCTFWRSVSQRFLSNELNYDGHYPHIISINLFLSLFGRDIRPEETNILSKRVLLLFLFTFHTAKSSTPLLNSLLSYHKDMKIWMKVYFLWTAATDDDTSIPNNLWKKVIVIQSVTYLVVKDSLGALYKIFIESTWQYELICR